MVSLFRILPGVGPRQAARFVLSLLEKNTEQLQELGRAIAALKDSLLFCEECFNLSDNGRCAICANSRRERDKLLVVEKITDLNSIERTGLYRGLYHVLGGAINPVEGVGPEKLRITELAKRVNSLAPDGLEVIVAMNMNASGETTALYLQDMLKNKKGVTLTRLARGLASGSHLEYADESTLKNALDHRK